MIDAKKKTYKIRMNAIDAPEQNQPFFKQASKALSNKIYHKTVTVLWAKKERSGYLIGDTWLNGRYINVEMIFDGWAWHYKRDANDQGLADAEDAAKKKEKGIWEESELPVPPWDWRKIERKKRKSK